MGRQKPKHETTPAFELDMAQIVFDRVFGKKKTKEDAFYNLVFCILVPQTRFTQARLATEALKLNDFMHWGFPYRTDEILPLLSSIRFKNRKLISLSYLKEEFEEIYKALNDFKDMPYAAREWLINHVHGIGLKTASHFMRNMGFRSFAIIDTHIIKFLGVEKPNTGADYIACEHIFLRKSEQAGVEPAIFDLAIWKYYSGVSWDLVTY